MATEEQKLKGRINSLLAKAGNADAVSHALGLLFPKVRDALVTFGGSHSDENSTLRHRVSRRDFAATYFGLDPKHPVWTRSELEGVLRSSAPIDDLKELMVKVGSPGLSEEDRARLRGQLLDFIQEGFASESPKITSEWVDAIVEISPPLLRARDTNSRGFYRVDNEERLRWLLVRPMRDIVPEDRAALVRSSIHGASDISLLCDVFRSIAGDAVSDGATKAYGENAFGKETQTLRDALVSRARKFAEDGTFWSQALPAQILWFWRNSDCEVEVKEFTKRAMNDRGSVRNVLDVPVSEVMSTAGNYLVVQNGWAGIIDLEALSQIALTLSETGTDEDKFFANRFLGAWLKAKERPL
jgi:hypothetical protein